VAAGVDVDPCEPGVGRGWTAGRLDRLDLDPRRSKRIGRVEATDGREVVIMPIYDYVCHACGHEFQLVERISEHEKTKPRCPECKSTKVERVLTGAFVKTGKKS
jgi:putative FmdB family regulatory protein